MAQTENALSGKSVLLVISGGIAAYKSLELIRLIKKSGGAVRCVLTKGGEQFVTPMSVAALSENPVYTDLWSLKDETEMGHIRLSREADIILVAPASANIIAQMAHGLAQDLATTTLLAADKPVIIAPAMNHMMWAHPATQDNIATLKSRGVQVIEPADGAMACGETGVGRMAEPDAIFCALSDFFFDLPLKGLKALVTAGPTFESIDPVRFIGNHSSGKQGYAIAASLARAGAEVTLISGPTALLTPANVTRHNIQSAAEMLEACQKALPADIAVCTAAVSDWRPKAPQAGKIKKRDDTSPPTLNLVENPDILKTLCAHKQRPALVIGFAAETENLLANAQEKRKKKQCDWILANAVTAQENVFGADKNHVCLITSTTTDDWGAMAKTAIADKLTQLIGDYFDGNAVKPADGKSGNRTAGAKTATSTR